MSKTADGIEGARSKQSIQPLRIHPVRSLFISREWTVVGNGTFCATRVVRRRRFHRRLWSDQGASVSLGSLSVGFAVSGSFLGMNFIDTELMQ